MYQILLFSKYSSNPHSNLGRLLDCRIEIRPDLKNLDDWSKKKKKHGKCDFIETDSRTLRSICNSPPAVSPHAPEEIVA